ncbi:MAG TPA: hypothetical protein VFF13_02175 [archaeon]|nr:hypothetical protein [archaeon]
MGFFEGSGDRLLTGVVIIVFSTILLLSGLNFFEHPIFNEELDTILAFLTLIIGAYLVFSETPKNNSHH